MFNPVILGCHLTVIWLLSGPFHILQNVDKNEFLCKNLPCSTQCYNTIWYPRNVFNFTSHKSLSQYDRWSWNENLKGANLGKIVLSVTIPYIVCIHCCIYSVFSCFDLYHNCTICRNKVICVPIRRAFFSRYNFSMWCRKEYINYEIKEKWGWFLINHNHCYCY